MNTYEYTYIHYSYNILLLNMIQKKNLVKSSSTCPLLSPFFQNPLTFSLFILLLQDWPEAREQQYCSGRQPGESRDSGSMVFLPTLGARWMHSTVCNGNTQNTLHVSWCLTYQALKRRPTPHATLIYNHRPNILF